MRIYYDDKVDALYLEFSKGKPEGVVEIAEGVNLDLTDKGHILGIEILDSSKKIDLSTIHSYQLNLNKKVINI
jgi:uncharacterized protein YuzE